MQEKSLQRSRMVMMLGYRQPMGEGFENQPNLSCLYALRNGNGANETEAHQADPICPVIIPACLSVSSGWIPALYATVRHIETKCLLQLQSRGQAASERCTLLVVRERLHILRCGKRVPVGLEGVAVDGARVVADRVVGAHRLLARHGVPVAGHPLPAGLGSGAADKKKVGRDSNRRNCTSRFTIPTSS